MPNRKPHHRTAQDRPLLPSRRRPPRGGSAAAFPGTSLGAALAWLLPLGALLVVAGCGGGGAERATAPTGDELEDYRQEVEAWHQAREDRLRDPEGYLALAGLHWLDRGPNRLGSDPMSHLVLPAQAPARVGIVRLDDDGRVRLDLAPGVDATVDGEPFRRVELRTDAEEDGPTTVALGSLRFHAIERGDWTGIRVRDLESPALAAFEGVETFEVDPAWRREARFEPYDPPREMYVDDVTGNAQPTLALGEVVFTVPREAGGGGADGGGTDGGGEHRLIAFDGGPDDLFLVFSDATSGRETYGAGRYLSAPRPGGDGRVVVDFNRAYNPPCAFTPYATCPLPPKENRLRVPVTAGEKVYRGEGVH